MSPHFCISIAGALQQHRPEFRTRPQITWPHGIHQQRPRIQIVPADDGNAPLRDATQGPRIGEQQTVIVFEQRPGFVAGPVLPRQWAIEHAVRERIELLSSREREVMAWVISGALNKQIAGELGIVEQTVKVHRARVMEKMQVVSVAELVRLCDLAGFKSAH